MNARWPAIGGARVLQMTILAWSTGGEEEKIMKEEQEVGKECQKIIPNWEEKERMDVHGGVAYRNAVSIKRSWREMNKH